MRLTIVMLTLGLLVATVTPLFVFGAQTRWYAHSDKNIANVTGLKADIETATPYVHPKDKNGGMSIETMWLIGPNASDGDRQWMEVGWWKSSEGLRFFSFCAPKTATCDRWDWHGTVAHGSTHSYRIEHKTGKQWEIYIDDVLKRTVTTGFSEGKLIDIGGETTDARNDIGMAKLTNVKYEINDDGVWRAFDGKEFANEGFWIRELRSAGDNMQNGTCWVELALEPEPPADCDFE